MWQFLRAKIPLLHVNKTTSQSSMILKLLFLFAVTVLAAKKKAAPRKDVVDMDKTIHISIEGWRHSSHSYALVCQHVALELIRRAERDENTEISFVDRPIPWQSVKGLFSEIDTAKLSLLTPPDKYTTPDIILRYSYPLDISAPASPDTSVYVHATAEYEVTANMFTSTSNIINTAPLSITLPSNVHLMSPSNWSTALFHDLAALSTSPSDVPPILTIPHGITDATASKSWRKKDIECSEFRSQTGIPHDKFAFLHIGAGTSNKNIAMLIHTFIKLASMTTAPDSTSESPAVPELKYPEVVLVLKTLSSMYPQGKQNILRAIREAQVEFPNFDTSKIIWMDDPYSNDFMSLFYRCTNAYVAPYQSEGFNLPVLQSIAAGTAVIVPKHGATDDFTTSSFARYVSAAPVERLTNTSSGTAVIRRHLDVDADSLLEEMIYLLEDARAGGTWLKRAHKAGVAHGKRYTWSNVVDKMIAEMAKEKPELSRLLSKNV